jgi:hypothetical protein
MRKILILLFILLGTFGVATAPTYLGTYTSGGTVTAHVICNGGTTTWLTD